MLANAPPNSTHATQRPYSPGTILIFDQSCNMEDVPTDRCPMEWPFSGSLVGTEDIVTLGAGTVA